MKKTTVFLALFAVLAGMFESLAAQATGDFNHHVIVLLDRSGSMKSNLSGAAECSPQRIAALKRLVTYDLANLCFQDTLIAGRPLLDGGKGDYLSIIAFGLPRANTPDFGEFIKTDIRNEKYIYKRDFDASTLKNVWSGIEANCRAFFNQEWSFISVAMPMGVYKLGRENTGQKVNRTFLILITDEKYNAEQSDPTRELVSQKGEVTFAHVDSVRMFYNAMRSSMSWEQALLPKPIERDGVSLKVYEFTPLTRVFALESILSYDAQKLEFKRGPDNSYRAVFEVRAARDRKFSVEKLTARLVDGGGATLDADSLIQVSGTQTIVFDLDSRFYGRRNLSLEIMAWVHFRDEAYGAHVLHPGGGEMQGANGLRRTIPVRFEKKMALFGFIPLRDDLYKYSADFLALEQPQVKRLWEILIVVTFLIVTLMVIKRRSRITNRNMDIGKLKLGTYK